MFRRYGRPEQLGTMSEEELAGYFGNSLCYTVNHWLCRNRSMDSETFLKQYGAVVTQLDFRFPRYAAKRRQRAVSFGQAICKVPFQNGENFTEEGLTQRRKRDNF